jgi:hypothetical protein
MIGVVVDFFDVKVRIGFQKAGTSPSINASNFLSDPELTHRLRQYFGCLLLIS